MDADDPVRIGVDIGGTFTDLVLMDDRRGRMFSSKVLTTPESPAAGVVEGVLKVLKLAGAPAQTVRSVVHGTTLATNAIIERKGARTALLTTNGFRDILETGKELRYDLYDLFIEFPKPLVPRRHRIGIKERTRYDGVILDAVDPAEVRAVASRLREEGIESIAVCFLHSYANPENERAVKDAIRMAEPGIRVSASADVLPEVGEYGRVSTTVANAYVQPLVERYLDDLVAQLEAREVNCGFYVMSSAGGSLSVDMAKDFPVKLVESGPAAGVSIASYLAGSRKRPNTLALDMGGTTAKICIIEDGQPTRTTEFEVARLRRFQRGSGLLLKTPAVDLIEIGAGGGSIASIDELGLLAVGPESAGAAPGPACYGRGGDHPTVTDADLVLGYLNPANFLGGEMRLDVASARAALDQWVGRPLKMNTEDAARSVVEVVNDNMANAASVYAAEKGIDLRDFTLFAFGGAAPAHACDVARRLGVRSVVVPAAAGVLSALGCLVSPLSFDFVVGYMHELRTADWSRVNAMFADLERRGSALLAAAGISQGLSIVRAADMRYLGQRYEVTVPLPLGTLGEDHFEEISTRFYDTYRRQFGREIRDVPIEAVQWRLTVSAPRPVIELQGGAERRAPEKGRPRRTRPVFFVEEGRYLDCNVYQRTDLTPGLRLDGPAIVEDRESTTVVPPSTRVDVDDLMHLVIDLTR